MPQIGSIWLTMMNLFVRLRTRMVKHQSFKLAIVKTKTTYFPYNFCSDYWIDLGIYTKENDMLNKGADYATATAIFLVKEFLLSCCENVCLATHIYLRLLAESYKVRNSYPEHVASFHWFLFFLLCHLSYYGGLIIHLHRTSRIGVETVS